MKFDIATSSAHTGMNPVHRVRQAQTDDVSRLAVLAAQVFLHTYATEGVSFSISSFVLDELTPAKFAALLQDPCVLILVAETGDNLVGLAVLRFDTSCPNAPSVSVELQTLYVQEHFVGQGIGTSLLEEAQALAKLRSSSVLWLTVNARNDSAISFYTRRSYLKIGVFDFVLGGVGHANHVMVQVSTASPPAT